MMKNPNNQQVFTKKYSEPLWEKPLNLGMILPTPICSVYARGEWDGLEGSSIYDFSKLIHQGFCPRRAPHWEETTGNGIKTGQEGDNKDEKKERVQIKVGKGNKTEISESHCFSF